MRYHGVIPGLALLVALGPAMRATRAQPASGGSGPLAVADSFFRASEQERWRDAARLMDLETFGGLRDQEVRNLRRPTGMHRVTPEELMKFDPKMPRVVAEYQAARSNEQMGRNDLLAYEYAGVSSVDSLAALPVEDAAARWLQARDPRYQMRRSLEAERIRCGISDTLLSRLVPMPTTKTRVLGTVLADSIAYVLYAEEAVSDVRDAAPDSARRRVGRRRIERRAFWVMPPPVLTLRRIGTRWRIAPGQPFGGWSGSASFVNCTATGSGDTSSVRFR